MKLPLCTNLESPESIPEDGQKLGLMGIIGDIVQKVIFFKDLVSDKISQFSLSRKLTLLENNLYKPQNTNKKIFSWLE